MFATIARIFQNQETLMTFHGSGNWYLDSIYFDVSVSSIGIGSKTN